MAALYGYLARTPSLLIGVSLPDMVGQRQPQNVPGTMDEYPNWRIPLADGEGKPVFLEDLATHPGVRAIVDAVARRHGRNPRAARLRQAAGAQCGSRPDAASTRSKAGRWAGGTGSANPWYLRNSSAFASTAAAVAATTAAGHE